MQGEVIAIFTSGTTEAPMDSVDEVVLETSKGLVGDRYYRASGTASDEVHGKRDSEITLIESEEIDRFNSEHNLSLGYGEPRRNIVTRSVRLNELVGYRFKVGDVVLEGVRLCEPCSHLAKTVNSKFLPGLVHRAGLRACVVSDGTVHRGDASTLG
jgi:MOSC domain-containing protein YiiM